MQTIDPRLLKWWGELILACSSNIELWNKIINFGTNIEDWYEALKSVPGVSPQPFMVTEINEMHRQWLAVFNAVPRGDYNNLKKRLVAVEEESERLRNTLNQITGAMTSLRNLPEAMAPWLELAQMTMKSHMEWMSELGKSWQVNDNNH
jgi:hypothetical protein